MKARFTPYSVTFYRESTDPKFYGVRNAAGESKLFNYIKKWLNARGFDLIKKRAAKDGHMLDDMQQYLRIPRKTAKSSKVPHIYLLNGSWAIEGAEKEWNKGEVTLLLETDVLFSQPDCYDLIVALGQKHGFEVEPRVMADTI